MTRPRQRSAWFRVIHPIMSVDIVVNSTVGVGESTQAPSHPAFKAGLVASYRKGELQAWRKLNMTQYVE